MSLIQVSVRGLDVFDRMRAELGDKRAESIASQTAMRMAKKVRTRVAREIASQTGIKKSLIDKRLTTWRAKDGLITLRFGGTGKFQRGFIRPRELGLKVPANGKWKTGRTRWGYPTVARPKPETYQRGFVLYPRQGAAYQFDAYAGRVGDKATLFVRTGSRRLPIQRVPGVRLADMVNLPPIVESARLELGDSVRNELIRRFAVDLAKIAGRVR